MAVAKKNPDQTYLEEPHFVADVLVVDDDPVQRAVTELFFKRRGAHTVRSANDGVEGLEVVRQAQGRIQLVVCDLCLPNMDGIQFVRHLGEMGFLGGLIFLSSEHDAVIKAAQSLARAHKVNLAGSLRRPMKIAQMEEIVHAFLESDIQSDAAPAEPIDVEELTFGLERGEITAVFQPKIDVRKLAVTGVEALARWTHPNLGVIAPGRFIPTAEEFGLIGELTMVVLESSIEASRGWRSRGIELDVAVNISSQLLTHINFPDEVRDRVRAAGLDPWNFVLEITESRLLQNDTTCAEVLARLRLMGFELSIDDFGTGYSNIEHLRAFPFSELKIDQSFVRTAPDDPFARASIDASVSLGRKLGLRLVAEGVETGREWVLVTEAGVDLVQGFYIARPMMASQIESWMLDAALERTG